MKPSPEQRKALKTLEAGGNVFLTGVAGSGKTHVLLEFLRGKDPRSFPVLASTGAAAILLGGRTFHSFFGLGVMEGGVDATVERALERSGVVRRLRKVKGFALDEVSMISGSALRAAERIARESRESEAPWGGLRVAVAGDFAQLPPTASPGREREWAFLDPVWERSGFEPVVLRTVMRSRDPLFLSMLNRVRVADVDPEVTDFLNSRVRKVSDDLASTRLYPFRDMTERYNLGRLEQLDGELRVFATEYTGREKSVSDLKRLAPVPEILRLKKGAWVMLRQNDPQGRWANGSLGEICEFAEDRLRVRLVSGYFAEVERASFDLLDAEGNRVAGARNFPVNLAYASTIHKAQGSTLDRVVLNLRSLWEPGHAYVALSRAKSADGVFIEAWEPKSFLVDPEVLRFHSGIF